MREIIIYTDGSCINNGTEISAGGYAAILIDAQSKNRKEISGPVINFIKPCTNQRAEIAAAIAALEAVKYPCQIILITDSQYVVNTMANGWKKKANKDLWERLEIVSSPHKIIWKWTRGHIGNLDNERADVLSKDAAYKQLAVISKELVNDSTK